MSSDQASRRFTPLVAVCALLSACGGGGGQVASTPTPPPVPGPASTNTSLVGTLVSESFTNDAVTASANYPVNGASTASAAPGTLTISYDATSGNYSLSAAGASQTFRPSDRDPSLSGGEANIFKRTSGSTTDSLSVSKNSSAVGTPSSPQYSYVGGGVWQRTNQSSSAISGTVNVFTYGVQTPSSAVPRTGTASFAVQLRGVAAFNDALVATKGTGSLNMNLATGSVAGSGFLNVVNPDGTQGEGDRRWTTAATLSSTGNNFAGDFAIGVPFSGTTTAGSGSIAGRLYGPAAQEVGASYQFKDSFLGTTFAGYMLGKNETLFPTNTGLTSLAVNESFASAGYVFETKQDIAAGQYFVPGLPDPHPDRSPAIRFSETTNSYVISQAAGFDNLAITPAMRDAGRSDATYDVYTFTKSPAGQTTKSYIVKFLKPGASNPLLALRYTSFAQWVYKNPDQSVPRYTDVYEGYLAFGMQTPASGIPRNGTATYAALLFGQSSSETPTNTTFVQPYDIRGNASLTFNFGAGALTGFIHPIAIERSTLVQTDLGQIDFGLTNYTSGSTTFSGQFTNFPAAVAHDFNGQFTGPNGQELVARWQNSFISPASGNRVPMFGIMVGKAN